MAKEVSPTISSTASQCVDRYIPLPSELYALRHQVPSLLHYILLECQRCFQWIPVEVTSSIPEELPISALEARAEQWDIKSKRKTIEEEGSDGEEHCWRSPRLRENRGSHHSPATSSLSPSSCQSRMKNASLCPSKLTDGNSPIDDDGSSVVSLFIPNPQCFICNGLMCEKGDRFLTLRSEWLRALYASCIKEEQSRGGGEAGGLADGGTTTSGDTLSLNSEAGRQQLGRMIQMRLSDELDIRRSERLACRKEQRQPPALSSSSYPSHTESSSVKQEEKAEGMLPVRKIKVEKEIRECEVSSAVVSGRMVAARSTTETMSSLVSPPMLAEHDDSWIRRMVQQTFQDSTTLSSAFCWVVCDVCGKVRRTAQPFPGGSPIICALTVALSCNVSESEGLRLFNQRYSEHMIDRIALLSSSPSVHFSFPLDNPSATTRNPSRDATKRHNEVYVEEKGTQKQQPPSPQKPQLPLSHDQREPLLRSIMDHPSLSSYASSLAALKGDQRQQTFLPLDKVYFPSLKALTTAIRKKSISTFVKKMALDPKEIQTKRESIGHSMFLDSVNTLGEQAAPLRGSEERASVCWTTPHTMKPLSSGGKTDQGELVGSAGGTVTRKTARTKSETVETTAESPRKTASSSLSMKNNHEKPPNSNGSPAPLPNKDPTTCGLGPRKRGRRKRSVDTVEVEEKKKKNASQVSRRPEKGKSESKKSIIHWIQCDKCDKWRIVPHAMKPQAWECSMRPHTTCEDSDDAKEEDY